jgi:FG-GAP repeat
VPDARDSGHVSGVLRIRPGSARGPAHRAVLVRQNGPHLPGNAQDGDRFGAALATGDLDHDGFADVLIGAPGEDGGAGRVTLLRGGRAGYAVSGNRAFEQSDSTVPGAKRRGHALGAALTLAPGSRRGALDLALAVPGDGTAGTLWVLRGITSTFAAADRVRIRFSSLRAQRGSATALTLRGAPNG